MPFGHSSRDLRGCRYSRGWGIRAESQPGRIALSARGEKGIAACLRSATSPQLGEAKSDKEGLGGYRGSFIFERSSIQHGGPRQVGSGKGVRIP